MESEGWVLYRTTIAGDWINLKLIHPEPIAGPANYWLGWSVKHKRFANTRDTARLLQYRPEVLEWMRAAMTDLYPTLSEAEILEGLPDKQKA